MQLSKIKQKHRIKTTFFLIKEKYKQMNEKNLKNRMRNHKNEKLRLHRYKNNEIKIEKDKENI